MFRILNPTISIRCQQPGHKRRFCPLLSTAENTEQNKTPIPEEQQDNGKKYFTLCDENKKKELREERKRKKREEKKSAKKVKV